MKSRIAAYMMMSFVLVAAAGLPVSAQAPSLDQILKEISNYDGGIDSASIWALTDYVKSVKDVAQARTACEAKLLQFLGTNATPAAKVAVTHHLRIIGSDRSVAALQPMLLDPAMSDMALFVIQKIQGAAADKALLTALPKAEGGMKTSIIAALGERKTVAAVPDLAGLLKAKGEFAGPAAIALGEIGGDAATAALSASLADAAVKPTAAAMLLKCAEGYITAKNSVAAAALYDKLAADAALPVPVRKAAMLGKISTTPATAQTIVLDLLKGKDVAMQEVAIGKIKDNFKPNAIGQVCSLLPGLPEGSQIKLLAVLSDYPKEAVLSTVAKAAQSASEPVRMAAYLALESVGDASVLKSLVETAAKARGPEQAAVRNAIWLLKGRSVDDAVLAWIDQNPQEEIQSELLLAVSERRIFAGKVATVNCLSLSSPRVRSQALRTLRIIGTPSDVPATLNFLLKAGDETEQNEAVNTAVALMQKTENQNGRASSVTRRLMGEKDPNARMLLYRLLGRIGDDSSLPILRADVAGTNEALVDAAARTLFAWPTPTAREDVFQIAQKSKNETHRLLALQAFLRMVRADRFRKPEAAIGDLRQAYALASRMDEKRLVIGALPSFICQDAFDFAGSLLNDAEVKTEAQAAIARMKSPQPQRMR